MNSIKLIEELSNRTNQVLTSAETMLDLPLGQLNHKPSPESWSTLECIEHLCRYGRFYIPEIRQRMADSRYPSSDTFSPGILGDYFAKSMLPREKQNKMKTFKNMNPAGSALDKECLREFIEQQRAILAILSDAQSTNLTKVKTSITISKWIKLRLGDTLRVVIYHNQRHILQAQRAIKSYE